MNDEKQPEETQQANPGFIDDLIEIMKGAKYGTNKDGSQFYKIDFSAITSRYLFHSALMLATNINGLAEKVDNKTLRDAERVDRLAAMINECNVFAAKNLDNLMPKPPPEEPKKEIGSPFTMRHCKY